MDREEIIKLIQENTMTASEVIEYLGISKQRLSNMNMQGKLIAIKKGLYLKSDVEKRKQEQGKLREKYLRS